MTIERREVVCPWKPGDHRAQADGVGAARKQKRRLTGLDDRDFVLGDEAVDRFLVSGLELAENCRLLHRCSSGTPQDALTWAICPTSPSIERSSSKSG